MSRTTPKQKSLVLILARELATNLATPIYIADADGDLVYFNEPAEQIASGRYAEQGDTSIIDWVKMLAPETLEGRPLAREEMPGGIAFAERRPAHGTMRITGLDGRKRTVETTALPLFGQAGEFHGIMAIFWELS
jgi:PAS domain-containing protein